VEAAVDTRALIAAALLALAGCQGPRPSVSDVRVTPSPLPGRYRVEAVVTNGSGGEGQIEVRIRLRDRDGGRVIEDERDLELRGRETAHLTADIEAPRGDYDADVKAEYPPE
jgi:hypothetical protein